MGSLGRGRGGLAAEEQTGVAFKMERGKVPTGKGAIIGQFLVEGEQVKGDVQAEFGRLIDAAERDASDRIHRDRIPRQYQQAVKAYFSNVRRASSPSGTGPEAAKPDGETAGAEKAPSSQDGAD